MKNMVLFSSLILSTVAFGASSDGKQSVAALIEKFSAMSQQAESIESASTVTFGASLHGGNSRVIALIEKFNEMSQHAETSESASIDKKEEEQKIADEIDLVAMFRSACGLPNVSPGRKCTGITVTMGQISRGDQMSGKYVGKKIAKVFIRAQQGKEVRLIENEGWRLLDGGNLHIYKKPIEKIEYIRVEVNEYCYPRRILLIDSVGLEDIDDY